MIKSVAFAGVGSVGAIYAELAVRDEETNVYAIVRNKKTYLDQAITVNGKKVCIELIEKGESKESADLLFIAVKWNALLETLEMIKPYVKEGTIIISLLNGISSEKVIAAHFPMAHVLLAMCSGIDSNRKKRAVQMNRRGKIVFGTDNEQYIDDVNNVCSYFDRVNIPYEFSNDIIRELWWKMMVNVGMNQVSAVYNLNYDGMRKKTEAMDRMHKAQKEVIRIANAMGIMLNDQDIEKWDMQLAGLSDTGMSSMLQDILAKRQTEVEIYGEEICKIGRKYGIDTPENDKLVQEIHEIESNY